jgi:tetratricopeptide (TPR) repeat protein
MVENTQSEIVQKAIAAIDRGDTLQGLIALESTPSLRTIPVVNSYLAYCMSRERGQHREALRLCQLALTAEPYNPAHYLNLGRIYLETGHKAKALATFRKGLSNDVSTDKHTAAESPADGQARQQALILAELRRLGIRKRAPFPSLPREHRLNRVVGKLLTTLNLR